MEAQQLNLWAVATGRLLDAAAFEERWIAGGQLAGVEHDVYYEPSSGRWFKANVLSMHANYLEFFQRLELHNALFPEAPVTLEGFLQRGGILQPLISQPDVAAVRGARPDEVAVRMALMGFEPLNETDYYNRDLGVRVEDLHDENALITPSGLLAFIDPIPLLEPADKLRRLSALSARPRRPRPAK